MKKTGLKLNIQKTKIKASSPITSWQREGEKVEAVTDFLFLGSKIAAGGDCSHGIKRHLLLGGASQVALVVKNLKVNAEDIRDADSIPALGRFPEGRHGDSLQYSCLENPMDRGAWWAMIHRVTKSQT